MATDNPQDAEAILRDNPDALKPDGEDTHTLSEAEVPSTAPDPEAIALEEQDTTPHPGGRPTLYGPEVVSKLQAAIQRQMSVTEACHYAGISRDTYYEWLEKYPEFSDKMATAKTFLFRKSKELITDDILTNKDVRTAKWLLEKKDPEFNPKTQVELGGRVEVDNNDKLLIEFLENLGGEDAQEEPNTNTEAPSG